MSGLIISLMIKDRSGAAFGKSCRLPMLGIVGLLAGDHGIKVNVNYTVTIR